MSQTRSDIVMKAWQHISCGSPSIPIDQLRHCFRAQEHPRVTSREKSCQQVCDEFENAIGKYASDDLITCEGFCEYYADWNCVLPWERDTYFCQTVTKVWGLKADPTAVSAARICQLEDTLFEKIRQRTHGADDEGKTVKRFFKHFDLWGNGTIGREEFKKALETLGCVWNDIELAALFNKYDV